MAPGYVIALLLLSVFLGGFLNRMKVAGFYPATLLADGLTALMIVAVAVKAIRFRAKIRVTPWILALAGLVVIYVALIPVGQHSLYTWFLTFRSQLLYAVAAVYIVAFVRSRGAVERLVRLAMSLGVASAAFGIVQFAFRETLPAWLLVSPDAALFGYHGTDITRSNGLLGNTIIYSAIMLMFFSVFVGKLLERFSWAVLASATVVFVALITTFSRMSILGGIAVTAGAAIYALIRTRALKRILYWVGGASLALLTLVLGLVATNQAQKLTDSFLISQLFLGGNASVRQSTIGHFDFIGVATDAFVHEPWVGYGVGSQSMHAESNPLSTPITDGAVWSILVDGGLLLLSGYVVLFVTVGFALYKAWRGGTFLQYVAAGLLAYSAFQLGIATFLNSAFFGKSAFILYWVLFGLAIAAHRISVGESQTLAPEPENDQHAY